MRYILHNLWDYTLKENSRKFILWFSLLYVMQKLVVRIKMVESFHGGTGGWRMPTYFGIRKQVRNHPNVIVIKLSMYYYRAFQTLREGRRGGGGG